MTAIIAPKAPGKKKNKNQAPGKIRIVYKYIDGAHFFVSDDQLAAGLCVASEDFATAYGEVSAQLSLLFKLNHGQDATFEPPLPVEEYRRYVEAVLEIHEQHRTGEITPSAIQPWMIEGSRRAA